MSVKEMAVTAVREGAYHAFTIEHLGIRVHREDESVLITHTGYTRYTVFVWRDGKLYDTYSGLYGNVLQYLLDADHTWLPAENKLSILWQLWRLRLTRLAPYGGDHSDTVRHRVST